MGIGFNVIKDAIIILCTKGVYQQVKAYQRRGRIYAAKGSSFVALSRTGTSAPNTNVEDFEFDGFTPDYDDLGRMYMPGEVPADKNKSHGSYDVNSCGVFDELVDNSVHVLTHSVVPETWRVVGCWAEVNDEEMKLPGGRAL